VSALDRARDLVRERGGAELAERLEHLDARASAPAVTLGPIRAPDRAATPDFDVVVAGGGLATLIVPSLCRAGLRVAVLDRGEIGVSHREWNAAAHELVPLVRAGIVSSTELDALVLNRYRDGFCRWAGGGTYPVQGVLDHAIDAGGLLAATRRTSEALGATLRPRHEVLGLRAGASGVTVVGRAADGPFELSARVVIDARGAASSAGRADLLCPTVGGVLEGLAEGDAPDEIDSTVGEILATTEGLRDARQHIWEAFPGRPRQTTVYLFYYAPAAQVGPGALTALYARFFETLPRYKRGEARLVKPTFGHIPGWSRLRPQARSISPRIVPFGDSAARHSPLTFCGFGKMLRTFEPAAARVVDALNRGEGPGDITPEEPIHALTGALAWMVARPPVRPEQGDALNRLLDSAFATLHSMGPEPYAALLRDEMGAADFTRFLHTTSRLRPEVYAEVHRVLGVRGAGRWAASLARRLLAQVAAA
jgi:lycopene cyclase CruA